MPPKPILELNPITPPLTGNEQFPLVQGGATKRASINDIFAAVPAGFVPTSTQIIAGAGLVGGGALTGNVTLSVADTGVTATSYGDGMNVPQFTVNSRGQITSAVNVPITISSFSFVQSVSGTPNEITVTGGLTATVGLASTLFFNGKTVSGGTFYNMVVNNITVSGGTEQGVTYSGGTLWNPTINTPTMSGGTWQGATLSGPVLDNPTINGATISGSIFNNATLNNPTVSGGQFSGPVVTDGSWNNPTISGGLLTGSIINGPTLSGAALGTPVSGNLVNCVGLPLTTGVSGILPSANGGTGVAFFSVSSNLTTIRSFVFPNSSATIAATDQVQTYTRAQRGAVVDLTASGVGFTPDFSLGNNFRATVSGAMVLNNPDNLTEGQSGFFHFIANAGGTAALTYGSQYDASRANGGALPVISTSLSSSIINYAVYTSSGIVLTSLPDVR